MGNYLIQKLDYKGNTFEEETFNLFYDEYYKKINNLIGVQSMLRTEVFLLRKEVRDLIKQLGITDLL